jgi:hypothetical protein
MLKSFICKYVARLIFFLKTLSRLLHLVYTRIIDTLMQNFQQELVAC